MGIQKRSNWVAPRIGISQLKLLEKLSNAIGVSGDESAIREIVLEEIRPVAEDIKIDAIGNVLAIKQGKGKDLPKVMLSAHMDEIGFMLTYDDGKGIFRFSLVGGIDVHQLAGKPVIVGTERSLGVIGTKPIHLVKASELKNEISLDALRIDLGPDIGNKVKIGDWATFATKFTRIGPGLLGKAMDNRLGVTTLITMLKNAPTNVDILAAFTVQEEVGLRGAKVAAYTLNPDMAFVLDCTPALDMPVWDGSENTLYRTKVDHGPAIYVADGATFSDPRLINLLKNVGEAYGIPYQVRQPGGGGTDAGAIHKQRSGIPSVSVSVPGRYLHTAAAIVRLNDWKNSVALLHAALSHIDESVLSTDR
jgi:putative aminopeptidase FrvX